MGGELEAKRGRGSVFRVGYYVIYFFLFRNNLFFLYYLTNASTNVGYSCEQIPTELPQQFRVTDMNEYQHKHIIKS